MSASHTARPPDPELWFSHKAPFLIILATALCAWITFALGSAFPGGLFLSGIFLLLILFNGFLIVLPIPRESRGFSLIFSVANSILASILVAGTGGMTSPIWYLLLGCGLGVALQTGTLAAFLPTVCTLLILTGSAILSHSAWTWIASAFLRAALVGLISWIFVFRSQNHPKKKAAEGGDIFPEEIQLQFKSLLQTAVDSIIATDDSLAVRLFSPAAENSFGYAAEKVLGRPVSQLLSSAYINLEEFLHEMPVSDGVPRIERFEVNCLRSDGGSFPAEMAISHIRAGEHTQYMLILQDITERKQTEDAFQQANAKLTNWVGELEVRNRESQLLNEMGDILQACLNPDEAYTAISEIVQHLFPSGAGIMGIHNAPRTLVEVKASWGKMTMPSDEQVFPPEECWALRRGRIHTYEKDHSSLVCHHVHTDIPDGYLCVPMLAQGEALGLLHIRHLPAEREGLERVTQLSVTLAEHISLALSNLRLRETLRNQSVRDPLTGLFNRRYMEESFERELARAARGHTPLGVIMMDIDHFKNFNDTYGHAMGDLLLKELGSYALTSLRTSDIACRYGGEEFLLILPDATLEGTSTRAEQICRDVSHLHFQNSALAEATVTLSLGVSAYPLHGVTSESLIHAADSALYQAKRDGRNRVVVSPLPSCNPSPISELAPDPSNLVA